MIYDCYRCRFNFEFTTVNLFIFPTIYENLYQTQALKQKLNIPFHWYIDSLILLIGAQYRSTWVRGPSGMSSHMNGNFFEQSTVSQYLSFVRTTQSFFSLSAFGCPGAHALYGKHVNGSPEKFVNNDKYYYPKAIKYVLKILFT